ncbi:MAG: DUF1648 domain-containing protein [Chitinophagaceae bacterium]|nr:DUF1648 domain-containing protein [Chitinophagaceae bacterium]MCZ2396995.1 DUF1648 domain-containing protein [Chitinophagales bacterium]
MEARPKVKISWNGTDRFLEVSGWLLLLFWWVLIIITFNRLPETIPSHFDLSGMPDDYSSKWTIFLLPTLASFIYIGLTILNRFPHKFNYISAITTANAKRQYTFATRMIRFLKWGIVLLFGFISYQTVQIALGKETGIGGWIVPFLIAGSLIFMVVTVFHSVRKVPSDN